MNLQRIIEELQDMHPDMAALGESTLPAVEYFRPRHHRRLLHGRADRQGRMAGLPRAHPCRTAIRLIFTGETMNAPTPQQVDTNCFVTVPETILPNGTVVPAFRVGQYACSKSKDGKAVVDAFRAPWVNINFADAKKACEEAGFKLITELQWLAMAYNASQQDCNWTKGKVGEGKLFRGLRKGNVSSAQPGNHEPADPKERRWLTLSNGECVCDINGNVYSWIFDDVQGDENGIIARNFSEDSPSITTAPFPSREKGMGDYEVWDWSGRALVRGGFWGSESNAGVFCLFNAWPGYEGGNVGFRCTKGL